jgi:hypothetical protein
MPSSIEIIPLPAKILKLLFLMIKLKLQAPENSPLPSILMIWNPDSQTFEIKY